MIKTPFQFVELLILITSKYCTAPIKISLEFGSKTLLLSHLPQLPSQNLSARILGNFFQESASTV